MNQETKNEEVVCTEQKGLEVVKNNPVTTLMNGTTVAGFEGVDTRDILLPKLLLMQGLSEAVGAGEAMMGDIIDSLTSEKLADRNTGVRLIPLRTFKTWVVFQCKRGSQKFDYDHTEPMTRENESLPLEEQLADGTMIRRDRTLNFYVLVCKEGETVGEEFPYVLSMRRTSYTAGRKFVNHFTKMNMLRENPWAKSVVLTCRQEKNDLGTYFVFDVGPGQVTSPTERRAAETWYTTLSTNAHRIDDSDLKDGEATDNEEQQGTVQY